MVLIPSLTVWSRKSYIPRAYSSIVLFLLIPDQSQPKVFNTLIAPTLKPAATIVVASGYNVFYKYLEIPPTADVVMVAPR
jgi:ketol-acid reductoisomerase